MKSEKGKRDKDKEEGGQSIGFQFNAPVTANNNITFINNSDVVNLVNNQGLSMDDLEKLDKLFQSFKLQVQQAAPQQKQRQAEEKVQELGAELSKGQNANAARLNKIIDGLVDMVPGALSAVVSMFANPILGMLVGPATKLVLEHVKK